MTTISFLIPCKKRPIDLQRVVSNLFQMAQDPSRIFAVCIVDKDDTDVILKVKSMIEFNENIQLFINDDTNIGYHGLCCMYENASNSVYCVNKDLLALWGDRIYIDTLHYDKFIDDAFISSNPYSFYQLKEKHTWNYAYPLVSNKLNRLVNVFKTEAPDAYMRYIAEVCGNNVIVKNVHITRINPSQVNLYITSKTIKYRKEILFRQGEGHKQMLLKDIQTTTSLCNSQIHPRYKAWMSQSTINQGPPLINTR